MDEDDDADPDDGEASFQLSQGVRVAASPPEELELAVGASS